MSGVCRLRDGLAMPKSMTDEHELVKKIVILMAPFSWRRRTYATPPAALMWPEIAKVLRPAKSAGHHDHTAGIASNAKMLWKNCCA